MIWFVRMARWASNPPSAGRVKFVLAVLGMCAVLYGIELIWGWPEALSPERFRRGPVIK